jgi:hypothetical protein
MTLCISVLGSKWLTRSIEWQGNQTFGISTQQNKQEQDSSFERKEGIPWSPWQHVSTSLPKCLFWHTVWTQSIWHHAHHTISQTWCMSTSLASSSKSVNHSQTVCLPMFKLALTIWWKTCFSHSGQCLAAALTSFELTFMVEPLT